jgi:hypothetical protein
LSIKRELTDVLLNRIRTLFRGNDVKYFFTSHLSDASLHAIMDYMKLLPSGDPRPLAITDFLRYGTFSNKLVHRIKRLRFLAHDIANEMLALQEEGFGDVVDTSLMQKFVVEQFTFLKRYVLRQKFSELVAGITQPKIEFWKWLLAWICTVLRYDYDIIFFQNSRFSN